jgi:hypothetical protein
VTVDVPDGWQPVHAAGVILAMAASQPPGTFRSNVTVSLSRFPADYQLSVAAEVLDASVQHLTEPEVITQTTIDLAGSPAHIREFAYVDSRAATLFQSHLLTAIRHNEVVDLVHVPATCSGARASEEVEELRTILTSLDVDVHRPV